MNEYSSGKENGKVKIVLVVVVYKTNIMDCKTLVSMKNSYAKFNGDCLKADLVIWDNSPSKEKYSDLVNVANGFFGEVGVYYKNTPENHPLSYVYNSIIEEYSNECNYVAFFDQDSEISDNYFNALDDVLKQESRADLYLPKIYHDGHLVSPSWVFLWFGRYYKDVPIGWMDNKNLSAINSGMILSTKFVIDNSFTYDDRLGSYCTDDYFMKFFRKNDGNAYVMNVIFNHELSLSTLNKHSDLLVSRYRKMLDGWRVVHGDSFLKRIALEFYIVIHKIRMCIKFKSYKYF